MIRLGSGCGHARTPGRIGLTRNEPGDRLGDPGKGQDFLGRADLDGGLGHAPDDARRLVLGDRPPVQAAEREQPRGAVAAHAGQQGGDARPGPVPGHAGEEHVDRGAVTDRPGLGE